MEQKQILRASLYVALGTVQMLPCLLIVSESIIVGFVPGLLYTILLSYIWSSTKIGRKFFREFYRSTLRLENLMFPPLR